MDLLMKFNCVSATRGGATIKLVEPRSVQQQQPLQQNQQLDNKVSLSSAASCAECCSSATNCSSVGGPCTDLACISNTTTPMACCVGSSSSNNINPPPPYCSPTKYINNQPVMSVQPPPPLTPLANNSNLNFSTYATVSADNLEWSTKHYKYEEPEENFISIDDAKIEKFLLRIGYEQRRLQQEAEEKSLRQNQLRNIETSFFEIVELDDDDNDNDDADNGGEVESQPQLAPILPMNCRVTTIDTKATTIAKHAQKRRSPDICLIPKLSGPPPKQKIIAEIDLLDSSDSECGEQTIVDDDNDSYEELPLTAAAALSCELSVDEDDVEIDGISTNGNNNDEDYVDVGEYGSEFRWNDCSEQKPRNLFECLLCGKKVQSNYNLRRHMMIHTGERPFGCDLCDRRFREFSDLKKHRRRHANESNYLCMICHQKSPLEHDSIRCDVCESKNLVLKSQSEAVVATKMARSMPKLRKQTQLPQQSPPSLSTSQQKSPPSEKKLAAELQNENSTEASCTFDAMSSKKAKQQSQSRQRAFQCSLCHREFGTRHNLKRHFMIHTGEKPFSCKKCRKPFREYSTLKKHMVTHQRDRWYKCVRCSHKYRDYLIYMAHKRTHPGWDAQNEEGVGDQRSKNGKQSHDDSNDGSYDYEGDSSPEHSLECCECGERFTDIDSYTDHIEKHDPKVVYHYECHICEEDFEEREVLETHMRTQHGFQYNEESNKN